VKKEKGAEAFRASWMMRRRIRWIESSETTRALNQERLARDFVRLGSDDDLLLADGEFDANDEQLGKGNASDADVVRRHQDWMETFKRRVKRRRR
jgi:hypothetical protein